MPEADASTAARRLFVYGVTGSGKTTMAARISRATGLPWHAVDDLTWDPNWIEVPIDEQRRRVSEICAREEWILDTAYGKWLDVPLARADLIVALDYPRWLSLQRLMRRTVARAIHKTPICNGNTETIRAALSRNSIIAWHFRSFNRKQDRIRRWMEATDGPEVLRFTRPRQADAWLAGMAGG